MSEFEITVDGKTLNEVLDEINDLRAGHDPMWWARIRIISGTLREPFEAPHFDEATGERTMKLVSVVPAGATLFGIHVGD